MKALAFAIVLLIAGCKTLPGCSYTVAPIITDIQKTWPPGIVWDGLTVSAQCDHK